MPNIPVDFSEAESFDPLDEGAYPINVAVVEVREGEKGPYLNWEFDVTHPEYQGRKLWMITSLAPKALFRLKEVFENLGVFEDIVDLEYDEDTNYVTSPELVGLPGIAIVTNEVYQGRIQNRVNQVLGPEDAAPAKEGAKKGPAKATKTTSRRSFK